MITLLFIAGCSTEPEPIETETDFLIRYAEVVCDQLVRCQPDSWAAKDGEIACQMDVRTEASLYLSDPCTSIDMDQGSSCLAAMEQRTCQDGTLIRNPPEACWELYVWDDACLMFDTPDTR